jgi:phage/plasmid-associated DNA primase
MFEEVNRIISKYDEELEEEFVKFKKDILNTLLQAMKELEYEGLSGTKTDERFLVIWLSDSDDEIINISAKQLNTQKVYKEFASEFITK